MDTGVPEFGEPNGQLIGRISAAEGWGVMSMTVSVVSGAVVDLHGIDKQRSTVRQPSLV